VIGDGKDDFFGLCNAADSFFEDKTFFSIFLINKQNERLLFLSWIRLIIAEINALQK
jgi:hypothetical protein